MAVAFHYNKNRNNSYFNPTLAQYQQFGYKFDNDFSCTRPTPVGGTAQNEATQSTRVDFLGNVVTNTTCSSFYGTRINPSNTANIRGPVQVPRAGQPDLHLRPDLPVRPGQRRRLLDHLETDNRLKGAAGPTSVGRDLNGDGDTLDTVAEYSPNKHQHPALRHQHLADLGHHPDAAPARRLLAGLRASPSDVGMVAL